jgi:hypothetical protein
MAGAGAAGAADLPWPPSRQEQSGRVAMAAVLSQGSHSRQGRRSQVAGSHNQVVGSHSQGRLVVVDSLGSRMGLAAACVVGSRVVPPHMAVGDMMTAGIQVALLALRSTTHWVARQVQQQHRMAAVATRRGPAATSMAALRGGGCGPL